MSFHGKMGKGYMRMYREIKREEATERQSQPIPHERTGVHSKAVRLGFSCPVCES